MRVQDKDTCVNGTQTAGAGANLPRLSKTTANTHLTSELALMNSHCESYHIYAASC